MVTSNSVRIGDDSRILRYCFHTARATTANDAPIALGAEKMRASTAAQEVLLNVGLQLPTAVEVHAGPDGLVAVDWAIVHKTLDAVNAVGAS